MLDHFIAKNVTAHKVNSYYTLAISYCTFCVGKHTILGPARINVNEFHYFAACGAGVATVNQCVQAACVLKTTHTNHWLRVEYSNI